MDFLTFEAKKAFIYLWKAFTKAPILRHFDSEYHIQIETDTLRYAIGGVLSRITLDQHSSGHVTYKDPNFDFPKSESSQWHPVAFVFRKMILAETRYKTHNQELLAIVEAFKTWCHYLEDCKHEVLILTDHNNLHRFMDIKSLSFRQICWAQELFWYHFRIDYRPEKANATADALSRFLQRSQAEEETLRDKNSQILYCLQASLTKATIAGLSLSGLALATNLLLLHQVLICGSHVLPRLCQFWTQLQGKLVQERPYQQANIGGLRLRLPKLQMEDQKARRIRKQGLKDGWEENANGVLYYQSLPFVPEIVRTELISRHHDDPLAGHFGINKTRELIARKYYWPTLHRNVEAYVTGYDVCLASKSVRHKPYGNLQSLPVPTYRWKDLSMDFVTGLPVSTNWKSETYDSILVIVNRLTNMVYYELVKVSIDALALAGVIIKVVVQHHGLPDSIVSDRDSVFTSKLWSSLYYFLGIKRKLSTAFHLQTDGQTEK